MGAAKTFSEWWRSVGPIDYKMDRRSAEIAWNAAQKAMEIAPSASTNSTMLKLLDTIDEVHYYKGSDTEFNNAVEDLRDLLEQLQQ